MNDVEECQEFGAPRTAGLVACSYCETRGRGAPRGVSGPRCGARCTTCASSLLRICVFCAQGTSVATARCMHCGETFEGGEERKRQRIEQPRQQQLMGLAAQGLGVRGRAAATPAGRGLLDEVLADLAEAAMGRKK